MSNSIADVRVPDSKLAQEATQLIRGYRTASSVPSFDPGLSLGRAGGHPQESEI
jgi:hypothetical protein